MSFQLLWIHLSFFVFVDITYTNPTSNLFILYIYICLLKDLWYGIRNLNMLLVIGFRRRQSMYLVVSSVARDVSVCSEDLPLWTTTFSKCIQQNQQKQDITYSLNKVCRTHSKFATDYIFIFIYVLPIKSFYFYFIMANL